MLMPFLIVGGLCRWSVRNAVVGTELHISIEGTKELFIFMRRNPIESGNLVSVGYEAGILEVGLRNGSVFRYYNVPMITFVELLQADSPIGYFSSHVIAKGYRHEEISQSINTVHGKGVEDYDEDNNDWESIKVFSIEEQAEINKYCKWYGSNVESVDHWGDTLLDKAIYKESVPFAVFLISKGADVNRKVKKVVTLLHWAVKIRNVKFVNFLVDRGASVQAKNGLGATPLHLAVKERYIEIVKFLVTKGADVNAKDFTGKTPLHFAACGEIGVAKFIISKGSNVNAKDNDGETPLHCAVSHGKIEVVKLFVSAGADVHAKDKRGRMPLHLAKTVEIANFFNPKEADANYEDENWANEESEEQRKQREEEQRRYEEECQRNRQRQKDEEEKIHIGKQYIRRGFGG
jgi:ankyrin repeat protein